LGRLQENKTSEDVACHFGLVATVTPWNL